VPTSPTTAALASPLGLSVASAALWLAGTTFLALLVIYFVGIDQGAVSVFGNDMHLHEFVHDGRHVLGFACH
jgi:Probable cobalt transporter subunit (CbtB)